jgi:hypothetical protein
VKRIFVSKKDENRLYDALVAFYSSDDEVIVYDRNLFNLLKKASRLFDPLTLERELSRPDLVVVFLSQRYLEDVWLSNELNAFFTLEQFRKTDLIVPVLLPDLPESKVPLYLGERLDRLVDFRGKTEEEGIELLAAQISRMGQKGKRVFIGHGHSNVWQDLRDHLKDGLGLEVDYFEREAQAGRIIPARLNEMLEGASFAFLVMTAEDEHAGDEEKHARENVIHEAGLFHGKLGLERAIILLEEGCARFSNKEGVIHLSFRPGKIKDCFVDAEKVLRKNKILL